ncbi:MULTISPECIES: phage tail family protein [Paenibacillus]|uniref:Phage-related protein n=1 Tax=Paenibacillus pabuli TaxID=1472 RepID=A0A855XUF7_9BACL|nr:MULTISPECIES: phage tail family protein [Paenibacillus]PWW37403.1 phage-related protein [Paenibacillus pabuli]PXW05545.1 phage-related protein [Paenibacillus taichungensis]
METVLFINSQGEKFFLGTSKPFYLKTIDGIAGVPSNLLSTKSPYQDGTSFVDMMLADRPISMVGGIIAKNQYELYKYRREITRILNPKLGLGTLIYTNPYRNYAIQAVAEGAPQFNDRIVVNQPFTINLVCPDPYFTDVEPQEQALRYESGGFRFPLHLPTQFAKLGFTGSFSNDGDVSTPVEIQYKGPALNPIITNETTGEFIKVNYNLTSSDVLIINTAFGKKRVEILNNDGTRTNVFHWIDLSSTFFQLIPGENILKYGSEREGDVVSAVVTILWNNRYGGV